MESSVVEDEGKISQLCELSPLDENTQFPRTETSNGGSDITKEDSQKTKEDTQEKKRITPTQVAFTEENIYAILHLLGQHIKKIESELTKITEDMKDMKSWMPLSSKQMDEMKKVIEHTATVEKKNHKQLVGTLQKLIDEQFGDNDGESESESDSDYVAKRRRRK